MIAPTPSQASPTFEGDVDPSQVPERYRLGPAYIPKGRYLDPEFLQLELDRLFPHTWQMACRLEELPSVGSYVEYLLGDRSVLVVRESADEVVAYHNACRHRGTRLAAGRGRVGSIICPFHGWRWNLDGSIRLQLDGEEFVERDEADLGLQPVRVEQWAGFVFINMDQNAPGLFEYLEPVAETLAPFHLERMRIRWFKSVTAPCNWKTVLDGFLEGYHIPGTHPQLNRPNRTNNNPATMKEIDALRSWSPTSVHERHAMYQSLGTKKRQLSRLDKDPARRPGAGGGADPREGIAGAVEYIYDELRALETERSVRAAQMLRTAEVPEGMNAGVYHLQLYRQLAIDEGLEWPEITPQQWAAAGTAWHITPNMIVLPNQGSALVYRARPHRSDPNISTFEVMCLEQIPVASYDAKWEVEPQHFDDYRHGDLGQILTQDLENTEHITVGMHSPSFDGHRLSTEQEMTIYNHHRVADRYLWSQ